MPIEHQILAEEACGLGQNHAIARERFQIGGTLEGGIELKYRIWPEMAANVYADGRQMWAGWVACLVGIGITVGEMIGGSLAKLIGKTKYQLLVVITLGTLFLGSKSHFPSFLRLNNS